MKVYHGTSSRNARLIMQHGIVARSITGIAPTFKIPGIDSWNYLCDHPSYYAYKRSIIDNCNVAAIIELSYSKIISLKKTVDDDTCEQLGEYYDEFDDMNYVDRRKFFRQWAQTQTDISYFETFLRNGSFSVIETIPVNAISRIAFLEIDYVKPFMKPPFSSRVSVFNYRYVKNKYKALNEWIFDGKISTKLKPMDFWNVEFPIKNRDGIEIIVPKEIKQETINELEITN